MINLLPLQEKKALVQEEKWKLILILGIVILAFLICLALIFLSIKTYISGQVEAQKIIMEMEEKEFKAQGIQNLEKEINSINQTLSKLNSFYQGQINLTEILERISEILPSGTYLTALSYNLSVSENYTAQISLSGFCPIREILINFKENLESQGDFGDIYFPPSNWVKPTNIDFSVDFKIK